MMKGVDVQGRGVRESGGGCGLFESKGKEGEKKSD